MKEGRIQEFAQKLNEVFDDAVELGKEIETTTFEIQWYIRNHEDFVKVCKELGVDSYAAPYEEGAYIHYHATLRRAGVFSNVQITNLVRKGGENEEV